MNKTRILALSLGIGVPVVVGGVTAGAVIGIKSQKGEAEIDPQIQYGEHVQKLTHTPIYQNEDFTITVTNFDEGYAKIDMTQTEVKINGKTIFPELIANNQLKINAKDVTSTDISFKVEMQRTVSKMRAEWTDDIPSGMVCRFRELGKYITSADFKVDLLWGNEKDGEWETDVKPGLGEHNYLLYKSDYFEGGNLKNITSTVAGRGYLLTEQDLKKTKSGEYNPYVTTFVIGYSSTTYSQIELLESYVCSPIEKVEFATDPEDPEISPSTLKVGEKGYYYPKITPSSALKDVDYSIVDDGGTGSVMTIWGRLTAGNTAGTVTIQVESEQDHNKKGTFAVTITE